MMGLRQWLPFVVAFLSVAGEMLLAGTGRGTDGAVRAVIITSIIGLAVVAVGASLFWSLGLYREGWGVRLVAAVPLVLSVGLAIVLLLESDFHARSQLLPPG